MPTGRSLDRIRSAWRAAPVWTLLVATAALFRLLSVAAAVWALASQSFGDAVLPLLGVLIWYWIGGGAMRNLYR